MRALLVVSSYHHKNTEKVAGVLADVLGAEVQGPRDTDPEALREYDLVGFGSGIDSDRHYKALLDLADELPGTICHQVFRKEPLGAPGETNRYELYDRCGGVCALLEGVDRMHMV